MAKISKTSCRLFGLLAMTLLLVFGCLRPALAVNIRVCLQSGASTTELKVAAGTYRVNGGTLSSALLAEVDEGDVIRTVRNGGNLTVYVNGQSVGTSGVSVSILATGGGDNILTYNKKQYRGNFSLLTNGYVLNILDLEEYLYGVVGQELTYSYPEEALRAQAIVARSYAYFNMGGTYYDVGRSTADQVYGGYTAETAAGGDVIVAAVDSTAHEVLYYDGKVVEALYCSSAGGYTEDNENVWGGQAQPYLRGVASPYDANYNYMDWQVDYSASKLAELAKAQMKRTGQDGSFGNFVYLEISYLGADGQQTRSGRATKVTMVGSGAKVVAENDAVRQMLGLRSNLFAVKDSVITPAAKPEQQAEQVVTGDEVYVLNASGNLQKRSWADVIAQDASDAWQQLGDLAKAFLQSSSGQYALGSGQSTSGDEKPAVQKPATVTVTGGVTLVGSGYGHGVGLSQFGAVGMAKDGYSAMEILRHYYGGENPSLLEVRKVN